MMPIVITYRLDRRSTFRDLSERTAFFQSLTDEASPKLINSQLITHLALKSITKDLADKTKNLNPAIKNSAAYVALEQNLCEYIKNSVDAHAKKITVTICDVIRNGHVIIHYHDDGEAFKASMLSKEQSSRDYHELIDHASHFASTKADERKAGDTHLQGSTGLGLTFTSTFLKEHGGKLLIGKSPKLIMHSLPYVDLRKAFRETRNIALTKLFCQDDQGHDINDKTDFSEIEEYGTAHAAQHTKNKSFGLKLEITAKVSGSLSSTDKSTSSDSAAKTHRTPSYFFATPKSPTMSAASTPMLSPTPRLTI